MGRGGRAGTRSQALQQAAPPSRGSAPLGGRCHLVLAAERKRRNTLPRPLLLLLLLWLPIAGPVSLIFLPGDLGWGRLDWGRGAVTSRRATGAYGQRGMRGPRRRGPMSPAPSEVETRTRRAAGEAATPGACGSDSSGRRAAGSRHPGSCRGPPAPISGPSSTPAGLGRRLRSATARSAALRAEPGRPRSPRAAAPPRSPSPESARGRALDARCPPGGPRRSNPELSRHPSSRNSFRQPSSAVLSLTRLPLCQKYTFRGRSEYPKKGFRRGSRILQAFPGRPILMPLPTLLESVSWHFRSLKTTRSENG